MPFLTASDRAVRTPGALQALLGEVFPLETALPVVLFFWELVVQLLPHVYTAPESLKWECRGGTLLHSPENSGLLHL